jgi:hypothetical protein
VRWGQLTLKTLTLAVPAEINPQKVSATLAGQPVPATLAMRAGRCTVSFGSPVALAAGQALQVTLS